MKTITLTSEQLAELQAHLSTICVLLGIRTPVLPANPVCYTSKTKSELAEMVGATTRTFSKWLRPFRNELRQMGVTDRTKLLPPQAVRFICEQLDIDFSSEQTK